VAADMINVATYVHNSGDDQRMINSNHENYEYFNIIEGCVKKITTKDT
jgi:hypothetical protein